MKTLRFVIILAALTAIARADVAPPPSPRPLHYWPEGRDIVTRDGTVRYTRALYGSPTVWRVETSDRPIFGTYKRRAHRNIRLWLVLDGVRTPLHETTHCEARYNAGRRTYRLTDEAWPEGASLALTVMAQPDAESAIWQFAAEGLPADARLECVVCDVLRPGFKRSGDMGSDPADSFDPSPAEGNRLSAAWSVGEEPSYLTLDLDSTDTYTLHTPPAAVGRALYDKAWAHHLWLAGTIEFTSPDAWLNPLGGALMAAADGAWDGETWLHGAVVWRQQLLGWRAGYLGDVLGLPDRARSHFSAYAASQVVDVPVVEPAPALDADKGLSRAAKRWGTPMYSTGYISRFPNRRNVMHHYDMNLNYIDELLWHFEYDADTAYMRQLWPVLVRHLEWEKRTFDPDDDGLYDAYCCIWASDALYYNSGAVTHSSAYNYRALRLAARVAELIGEDPTPLRDEAEKTLRAMNARLWLDNRGHWAEYQDYMGLGRVHTHAALWSIYTPIDCGAASPEQALRATQYVDSCIPHIPVVYQSPLVDGPLYTVSTTDWQPYDWSINNVAAEEVMHTALAYFEAGRADEGYALVKANIIDQAYAGGSPGNFGQISYYDRARGELYRDFADNVGISARTFIQGLYGIVPHALDGTCVLRPGFPAEWDSASISTPYFKYTFRRDGDIETYDVEQHFARPLRIVLRQNVGDGTYVETVGTDSERQTFVVRRAARRAAPSPLVQREEADGRQWGNAFDDVKPRKLKPVRIDATWNAAVGDIFKADYLSPRSPYTTLQIPIHGIGEWCHPEAMAVVDDSLLRRRVGRDGTLRLDTLGLVFRYGATGNNICYTSLWDNYPDSVVIPLSGRAERAYLLMAGSTNHMQSHIDNAIVVVRYGDGTSDTLALRNPHNWCPVEQDYYEDGRAFHAARPRPLRVDFSTGRVGRKLVPLGQHYGRSTMASGVAGSYNDRSFAKGAGVVLDMPLRPNKTLQSLTLRTLSNDVIVGLMAITLQQ